MWSKLTKYLVGGAAEEDDQNREVIAVPVEARLRQVEVEGDDWILIDRTVEGFSGMDESWYVTPPPCFTQPGPVHVETSPLEDLLIEHPSMSVYRAARSTSAATPDPKPAADSGKKGSSKRRQAPPPPTQTEPPRLPLLPRSDNLPPSSPGRGAKDQQLDLPTSSNNSSSNNRPSHHHNHLHHRHHHHPAAVAEQPPRRATMRDLRNARGDENVRNVQIRSAQKMLEKRTSQSSKRNRLERGNKSREVASGKGRRPRRQDRLRLNNSGANNNRKC